MSTREAGSLREAIVEADEELNQAGIMDDNTLQKILVRQLAADEYPDVEPREA
jgi:hypothetical protein